MLCSVVGYGDGAPAEIEIGAILTAKCGHLMTSFSSNHENIWYRNPTAYILHAFELILHTIRVQQKEYPYNFGSFLSNF